MQGAQLSVKTNYSIAEGTFNTAPVATITFTGTISSNASSPNMLSVSGLTAAEKLLILQDDGIVINGELLIVMSYDSLSDKIYLKNNYGGASFSAQPLRIGYGPKHAGYPREYSLKGQLFKKDLITFTSALQFPYNSSKKRVSIIEALSGVVTVSEAMQSPDAGAGSGGSGALVGVFEPDTIVLGAEGVGYIQDARMANKPHPPYFFIITVDGLPLNIYSATAIDNEIEYNADATLGRFDAINSFEFVTGTTILVTIYLLS